MIATAQIERPDDVSVSVTITMPMSAWKRLHAQLQENASGLGGSPPYPSWKILDVIDATVRKLGTVIEKESKTE